MSGGAHGGRTVCPYCGVGCGVIASVRADRVVAVRGDPDHPANRGGLCGKGQRLAETVRTGDRHVHPMRRPLDPARNFDRSRPWERIGWDEALADCAARLRAIQETHGRNSVAFYLSGQLLTEDYCVANKLVKGFLGTNNVDTNSRLCMASAVAAYKLAFGSDAPPGCYDDADDATCVVFLGSNAAETHPVVFGRLAEARRRTGARWIVIDPRRTSTAESADIHLPVTPGSDVALLLAMLNVVMTGRMGNTTYVRKHTSGYDDAAAVAREWPPERAAEVCGVAPAAIREAARLFATSRATMSLWCQGLNQSIAGTSKNLALINLHLATGQLGRPGAGPFSLTGQANAMGGREVGGMATELAAHRKLGAGGDRREVEEFWGSGPIDPSPGLTAVELVDALHDGRVRAVWIAGTNPLASLPDGARAEAAFRRAELVVVQELFHPTDTTMMADVVLPAAGWAEKTGTLTSSERRVALAEALVRPPGEARPDWEIFAGLGAHLGHRAAFTYHDASDVFDEHVALTRGTTCDMSGLSHDRLRREGPMHWPCPSPASPGQARRYTGGVFATADGRARLHPTPFVPPFESPTGDYPFRLTTVRSASAWHTLTKTGKVAELRRQDPGARVLVHPDDADAAGVEQGGAARVVSRRGTWRGRATCTDEVPRGTLAMFFHTSPLWARDSWVNRLMPAAADPRSGQPELKHAAVALRPATSSIDGLIVIGGDAAHRLGDALADAGVSGVSVRGWNFRPFPHTGGAAPWCAVFDGGEPGRAWLRSAGLTCPVLVDAAARIVGMDAGYAVGAGVHTVNGLPVDTEPGRLAGALIGEGSLGPRALARARFTDAGPGVAEFHAGEPDAGADDDVQGIEVLRVDDTANRLAVTWRLAGGQVLGVSARGPRVPLDAIAAAWYGDCSPLEVRANPTQTFTG